MVNCMADEVSGIDSVSVADKVQHLMLTYAEPMKAIKGDKNLMATIRGMLWCALAPDVLVEVKPKKGEEAAVFQKAGEVTQGAARHVVAKLKQAVAERDQTDAEREAADAAQAEREEKAAEAKKAADKAKKASGTNLRSKASLPAAATKAKNVDDFIGALVDERMSA